MPGPPAARTRSLLAVVVVLVQLTVLSVTAPLDATASSSSSSLPCAQPPGTPQFIVRFSSYAALPVLEAQVRAALLAAGHFEHVAFALPLQRAAAVVSAAVPTDFVLVAACAPLSPTALAAALAPLPAFAALAPQRRYVRAAPLAASDAASRTCYAPADEAGVRALWARNATGQGVRLAVFDTGLDERALHRFRHLALRVDYTHERGQDALGHGTLVAGVVAAAPREADDADADAEADGACAGIAPDVALYIFRVFTSAKVSYTTWFLDAFNHAMHLGVHIINLSIGGPDFEDQPFVDKVRELSANNVIVVSAVGNDGPHWGSVNNPADQLDVLAVGGLARTGDVLAPFSSRGMTTWELPRGYGRVKPDLLAPAQDVCAPSGDASEDLGATILLGDPHAHPTTAAAASAPSACRAMSGTSASAPLVSGAIALLASALSDAAARRAFLSPARVKLLLTSTARRVPRLSVFEQGAGALDLVAALEQLLAPAPDAPASTLTPTLSALPSTLDLTPSGCPYTWPWCAQPLYARAQPLLLNVSLVNARSLAGVFTRAPRFEPDAASRGVLAVRVTHSARLWPWSGWLALAIRVVRTDFVGVAQGDVVVHVDGGPELRIPLRVSVVATPPRAQRLLWDQFHQLRFPSGYFPRDALRVVRDPFDWLGDHVHTNFRELWESVRAQGYFVEVLGASALCFDARDYGALLVVDTEDEWDVAEVRKVRADVEQRGLSLVVVADWYDRALFPALRFFDENTRQWWTPLTGGANAPALNALLAPWGIAFGERVYDGKFAFAATPNASASAAAPRWAVFGSGVPIAEFPAGGRLVPAELVDFSAELLTGTRDTHKVPILGFYAPPLNTAPGAESGRVTVFGDSTCLDAAGRSVQQTCLWLLRDMLRYATHATLPAAYAALPALPVPFKAKRYEAARPTDTLASAFTRHSRALHADELRCDKDDEPDHEPDHEHEQGSDKGDEDESAATPLPGNATTGRARGVFRRGGTMRVARGDAAPGSDADKPSAGDADRGRLTTLRSIVAVLATASAVVLAVLLVLRYWRAKAR